MSLDVSDVPRMQELLAKTIKDHARLIQVGQDLRALENDVQEHPAGYSLDEFYGKLPPSLVGLVEFIYDLNQNPGFRIFENFLYDDDLLGATQEIWLHQTPESDRQFFMSTPRLETSDSLSLPLRFSDKRIDTLAAARLIPQDFDTLAASLELSEPQRSLLRTFFTDQAPLRRSPSYKGNGVRMRYFGHACVLFETDEVSVLIDPFFSTETADDGRLQVADLPDRISYVILTHCHQDHFCVEMLLQLRHRIDHIVVPDNNSGNLADPSMKLALQALGFERVEALKTFESLALPGGRVDSLPFTGEHADLNIHSKHALALHLRDKKFLFLIDSDGRDPHMYKRMLNRIGAVDAMFIGMECQGAPLNWLYEPLLGRPVSRRNNESRRLSGADSRRAAAIQAVVQAPRVFVYAMGQEPWMKFMMGLQYAPDSVQLTEAAKFIEDCRRQDVQAERLYLVREVEF